MSIVEFDRSLSWSLDASETGKSTPHRHYPRAFCTLPSFARIKRPRARSIHHFHIPHNTPCLPPKICITFVFHFPWVLQSSQEKRKTMLMQNFGGQTRCIMGDVEMANSKIPVQDQMEWNAPQDSGLPNSTIDIYDFTEN